MRVRLNFVLCRQSHWCAVLLLASYFFPVKALAAQAPDQTSLIYTFADGRQTHTSFELNSNHIYVPIRVKDSGPYWFMLDSGAIFDVLDTDMAKCLGIKPVRRVEGSGGGEKTITGATAGNISLSLSGLRLKQSQIYLFPVKAKLAAADGRTVAGLLGYDFLNHFVVRIDYLHQQIDVLEPAGFEYTGSGEMIPLEIVRGNIMISAELTMSDGKRVPGTFLVDTGWRSALTLTSPFVASQKLLESIPKAIEATTGMGVSGPTVDAEARIGSLKIGRYTLENLIADFSHAKTGILSQGDFAGIIGGEILRRFTITLDYPHKRMILEPNAMFTSSYDIDMSGLFLTFEISSGVFKVYSVTGDSPAAEAGIQPGDIIETIGERPASDFSLEQVRQMFKEAEGKEHRLRIRRGGKSFSATIRLRRMV